MIILLLNLNYTPIPCYLNISAFPGLGYNIKTKPLTMFRKSVLCNLFPKELEDKSLIFHARKDNLSDVVRQLVSNFLKTKKQKIDFLIASW